MSVDFMYISTFCGMMKLECITNSDKKPQVYRVNLGDDYIGRILCYDNGELLGTNFGVMKNGEYLPFNRIRSDLSNSSGNLNKLAQELLVLYNS